MSPNTLSERKFCVYKITNLVNGKIYIGKTFNIEKRWAKHLETAANPQRRSYSYIHKSINKYGVENFKIEIIEIDLSMEQVSERERLWIKELNSKDPNIGMNLTDGGEGTAGLKWSEESRDKKRGVNNPNFGKHLPESIKEKLSKALSGENNPFYGKKHTKEVVNFLKNREISDDIKDIISENCKGERQWNAKFSDNDIIQIRKQWDNGEKSQTELAKEYGVKPNTINQIVNRKRWTHI
jgi:group I intron endonuclease